MAAVHRYVNNSTTTSGDGTTNAEGAGGSNAYISLSAWEAAEQADLVTATDTHTVHCSQGTSGSSLVDNACDINGWTCNTSYFVTVRGHDSSSPDQTNAGYGRNTTGIFDAANYFTIDNATFNRLILTEASLVIENMQFYVASGGTRRCITTNSAFALDITIRGNIFHSVSASGSNLGIHFDNGGTGVHQIYNNTFNGFTQAAIYVDHPRDVLIYNNTIYDCGVGIQAAANQTGNLTVKNNAIFNSGTADFTDAGSGTHTLDYNATDYPTDGGFDEIRGANGIDLDDDAGGEWVASFVAHGSANFKVKDASAPIYDVAVPNSADSNVPTTDIIGTTRSTYDIGAFESVVTSTEITTSSPQALAITEHTAVALPTTQVAGTVQALTIAEYAATTQFDAVVAGAVQTLTISEQAASLNYALTIEANTPQALEIVEIGAGVVAAGAAFTSNVQSLALKTFRANLQLPQVEEPFGPYRHGIWAGDEETKKSDDPMNLKSPSGVQDKNLNVPNGLKAKVGGVAKATKPGKSKMGGRAQRSKGKNKGR